MYARYTNVYSTPRPMTSCEIGLSVCLTDVYFYENLVTNGSKLKIHRAMRNTAS